MAVAVEVAAERQPVTVPAPVPLRELAPWAIFATVLFLAALYLVTTEQGALSIFNGNLVHEFMHDARHLIGVPCH
jgi:hypothetical protein